MKLQCKNEVSALHLCAVNPLCIEILELLLLSESSSNVNVQDQLGFTPLHYAIAIYNIQAVQYFL